MIPAHLVGQQQPVSAFREMLSPYLMEGYRKEEFVIDNVTLNQSSLIAEFSMSRYFMPGDGVFHLTAPIVFMVMSQLCIIYTHVDNDLKAKTSEVYVHEFSLKCKRTIKKPTSIGIQVDLVLRRRVPGGVYYVGRMSVENGAFVGVGKFLLPLA